MAVVFLFSGQGSQYYHMGKELYHKNEVFKRTMEYLDQVASNYTGESILKQMYDPAKGRGDIFNRTLFTSPAIFMLEYSAVQVMLADGIQPDVLFGTSLGEFVATTVAGALSVEDTLELVIKQAQTFEATCEAGGMITIVDHVNILQEIPVISEYSELVGVNFEKHFVISGITNHLKYIEHYLKKHNIIYQFLPVSFAFHSKYIEPAADRYLKYLSEKQWVKPKLPLISARFGREINALPQDYFWQVARNPILFQEALQAVVQRDPTNIFYDLGPSGTLANFVKYNLDRSQYTTLKPMISPFQ